MSSIAQRMGFATVARMIERLRRSGLDRPQPPIGRYRHKSWFRFHKTLMFALLIFGAAVYGFAFAIFGRALLIPLTTPIIVMLLLAFWVVPDTENPPLGILSKSILAFFVALLCWPDYIALALPGMPWITAIRLTSYPMLGVFLVCLSTSKNLRSSLLEIVRTSKFTYRLVVGLTVLIACTIFLSHNISFSTARFVVFLSTCTASYFIGGWFYSNEGRIEQFSRWLLGILLFCFLVGLYEARYSKLPWAGHIPSFLAIEDQSVIELLAGSARAFVGSYRVQSKFSTALSFGEFIGIGLPFIIHAAFQSRSKLQKALTAIAIIVGFYIVLKTDSRLAVGSFFAAVVLYGAYWAYHNWRENRQSVLAPMLLLAYPAGMGALFVLSFAWHRLEVMIWGGAATQSSTDARKVMLDMGLPMVYRNPIGHGFGMGAETLGFFSPGGKLTIDIYYLNAALEYGVIGMTMFFLIFAIAAFQAAYVGVNARKGELTYGVPIAIALVNFLISKTVLSQQENHPLAFLLVGMAAAVVYREKQIA